MIPKILQLGASLLLLVSFTEAFSTVSVAPRVSIGPTKSWSSQNINHNLHRRAPSSSALSAGEIDLDVVALVAGQENYGLAVVCLGEAFWSFFQAPSLDHAKVLIPASVAAIILVAVSGPMITSGDASAVSTGLFIATGVSVGLGASYVARLLAKFSPSAKEIAAFGLVVAIAGFFSFSQNLLVDGFVTLPSIPLPSIPMPEVYLPSLDEIAASKDAMNANMSE